MAATVSIAYLRRTVLAFVSAYNSLCVQIVSYITDSSIDEISLFQIVCCFFYPNIFSIFSFNSSVLSVEENNRLIPYLKKKRCNLQRE